MITFKEYLEQQFQVNQEVLKKLISGQPVITPNWQDVAGLNITTRIHGSGDYIGTSNLPELKNMEFLCNHRDGLYYLKRMTDEDHILINKKYKIKQIVKSLLSGKTFTTKDPNEMASLLIRAQTDAQGKQIGVSDLPELKDVQFEIHHEDGTWYARRM